MSRSMTALFIGLVIAALSLSPSVTAQKEKQEEKKPQVGDAPGVLWREPADIASRNLFYGPGGKENEPRGKFKFKEEDLGGSNPKFEIEDEQGTKWKVKLGAETRSETAATHLLWAVGYFADEDYYLPELRVEGLPRLARGQELVGADGAIRGARLERNIKGDKTVGPWSWFDNPFVGTKELNGLKVMMALMNNWDLKAENNKIYDRRGAEQRYVVTDLGACFGRTGNTAQRSRGVLADYAQSKFIEEVEDNEVDFVLHSRPSFRYFLAGPYYRERTAMEKIVKGIPRADAKWIGGWLGRLSPEQISDAFRAAGFSAEEVQGYTKKVRERIEELKKL